MEILERAESIKKFLKETQIKRHTSEDNIAKTIGAYFDYLL